LKLKQSSVKLNRVACSPGRQVAAVAILNPLIFSFPCLLDRVYLMTTRRQTSNDDTIFWTLKLLQDNPGMTQRSLAKEVGINVSSINFCLKALVEKGWIKMGNFSRNSDKLSYAYLLTPTGLAEKTVLTRRFLQRKMAEYDKLRGEIEAMQQQQAQTHAALTIR
jgi:EPS-associated MarR family transcriptional regulator